MKTKLYLILILLFAIAFTEAIPAQETKAKKNEMLQKKKEVRQAKSQLDLGFESFWKELQNAVITNNKQKAAYMVHFPLKGDFEKGFPDGNVTNVPACNETNFIKTGFDDIFQLWIKDFEKIGNVETGKIENNTMYRFTSFPDLFKAGSLPDYLTNTPDGVELEIYDYITPDDDFSISYYFQKENGSYKLVATHYTE